MVTQPTPDLSPDEQRVFDAWSEATRLTNATIDIVKKLGYNVSLADAFRIHDSCEELLRD